MALRPHAQQVDIEIRCRLAGVGVGRQQLFVGQRRGGKIIAEFTVAGRHRVHMARRDVDVIEQRLPRLLVVALVVILGNVAFVAPEQMHLGPVDLPSLCAERLQQPDPVAAAGQHDQRSAPGRYGGRNGIDQSPGGGRDQDLAFRKNLDDGAHTYCTFSMPSSAVW